MVTGRYYIILRIHLIWLIWRKMSIIIFKIKNKTLISRYFWWVMDNYCFLHGIANRQQRNSAIFCSSFTVFIFWAFCVFRVWLWLSIYWQRCSGRSRECFGFLFVRVSARRHGEADDSVHWLYPTYRRHHAYCRDAV